jgi:hypothetical protein
MSTLAQITTAIDDNIRNFEPLVLKVNHANVEQLITDQLFPDSVQLTFNIISQTSGLPNITVPAELPANWKISFNVFFEKVGNRVFYSGFLSNEEPNRVLGNSLGIQLATFLTLYNPLEDRYSSSTLHKALGAISIQPNAVITVKDTGMFLYGSLPIGAKDLYFEGSYKVAN